MHVKDLLRTKPREARRHRNLCVWISVFAFGNSAMSPKIPVAVSVRRSRKSPASAQTAVAHAYPALAAGAAGAYQVCTDCTTEEAAKMAFLADPKARRAAYGRMATALAASGDREAEQAWHIVQNKTAGLDLAKRKFLEGWIIDPSFAKSKMEYSVELQHMEGEDEEGEDYTRDRLEHQVGKEEADSLIDGGLLEETTDKYGRQAWKYSLNKRRRGTQRINKAKLNSKMEVNPTQAATIRDTMNTGSIGLEVRGKKRKAEKLLTPDEQKQADLSSQLKAAKTKVTSAFNQSKKATEGIKGSKHPVAGTLRKALEESQTALDKQKAAVQTMVDDAEKTLSSCLSTQSGKPSGRQMH